MVVVFPQHAASAQLHGAEGFHEGRIVVMVVFPHDQRLNLNATHISLSHLSVKIPDKQYSIFIPGCSWELLGTVVFLVCRWCKGAVQRHCLL